MQGRNWSFAPHNLQIGDSKWTCVSCSEEGDEPSLPEEPGQIHLAREPPSFEQLRSYLRQVLLKSSYSSWLVLASLT